MRLPGTLDLEGGDLKQASFEVVSTLPGSGSFVGQLLFANDTKTAHLWTGTGFQTLGGFPVRGNWELFTDEDKPKTDANDGPSDFGAVLNLTQHEYLLVIFSRTDSVDVPPANLNQIHIVTDESGKVTGISHEVITVASGNIAFAVVGKDTKFSTGGGLDGAKVADATVDGQSLFVQPDGQPRRTFTNGGNTKSAIFAILRRTVA